MLASGIGNLCEFPSSRVERAHMAATGGYFGDSERPLRMPPLSKPQTGCGPTRPLTHTNAYLVRTMYVKLPESWKSVFECGSDSFGVVNFFISWRHGGILVRLHKRPVSL
jgi:hypothetical protein